VPASPRSIFRKSAHARAGDVAISGRRSPWVANRAERPDILRMSFQSSRCLALGLALGSTVISACSPATPEVAHPAPAGSAIPPGATDADPSVPTPPVTPDAQVTPPVPEPAPHAPEPAAAASERCTKDADCVPASCCHPTACVPKSQAPNCAAVMCTMECRPKTLDCGGRCTCVEGRCSAVLSDMSHLGPARPR
jgi:hypothetical protein